MKLGRANNGYFTGASVPLSSFITSTGTVAGTFTAGYYEYPILVDNM